MGSSLSVLAYSVVGEGLSVRCSVALGASSFKVIMHDRPDGLHDMEGGDASGSLSIRSIPGYGGRDASGSWFIRSKNRHRLIANASRGCFSLAEVTQGFGNLIRN